MSGSSPSERLGLHRSLLTSQLLQASATVLAAAVTLVLGQIRDVTLFLTGAGIIFACAALVVLTAREALPSWLVLAAPVIDIVAIGVMRESAPVAGIGLLWAFPAMWLGSVYGIAGVVGVTAAASAIITYQAFDEAQRVAASTFVLPFTLAALATMSHFAARRTRAQRSLLEDQSAELRRSLERSRRQGDLVTEVLDAVDFGVIRITAEGEYAVSNEAHARLQASADPLTASSAAFSADGITPLEPDKTPLARARSGEVFEGELVWYGVPGEDRRALNVTARRLPSRDGVDGGSVVVSRDVTAEELALRAREDLVASVSHELRTPLTSIIGYLELALDDDSLAPATREQLEIAERNATRLRELVADILAMSAASRHGVGFALNPAVADVAEIVESAVTSVAPRAATHGIRIDATDVRACPAVVDAHRLRQVVDNLLSNAVKYNHRDGVVTVSVGREDDTVVISVADDGQGISANEQGRIFERFFRADEVRNSSVHGSGLGLAISRDIVRAHGGDITVRSEPGSGSVFTVRLPQKGGAAPWSSTR
jgi:signal transduction histidine kinase